MRRAVPTPALPRPAINQAVHVSVCLHCGLGATGTKEQSASPRSSQVTQISPEQLTSTGFTCKWIVKGLGLLRSWPKACGDGFAVHPPSCPRSWGFSKLCSLLGSSWDLAAKQEDFSFLLCLDVTAAFRETEEDPGGGQRGRLGEGFAGCCSAVGVSPAGAAPWENKWCDA